LERSDQGFPAAFIRFIATQAVDAMNLVRTMLKNSGPPVADTLLSLREIFNAGSGDEELIAAAIRIRSLAIAEAAKQLRDLHLPAALTISPVAMRFGTPPAIAGYADIGDQGSWTFSASCDYPKRLREFVGIATLIRHSGDASSDLLMTSSPDDGLEVWMREIVPSENETLKLKLAAWIEARIGELLVRIKRQMQQ